MFVFMYKPYAPYFTLLICAFFCLSSCQLSKKTTVNYFQEAKDKTYDVIVVPGYPFEGEEWDRIMKARVHWAKHLIENGMAKNIIFSGGAVYTPYYESQIMRLYAIEMGIPENIIHVDTFAEHSTENIYYSYQLAEKLGYKTVALASDPFQTKQLRRFIKKRIPGEVGLIPIVWDTLFQFPNLDKEYIIDPSPAFKNGFVSIKEKENLWQRLKGTRGKQIDKSLYN